MLKIIRKDKYILNNDYLVVGIADLKISKNPHTLVTYALGSCVAIILHDPRRRMGALIHAMLPTPGSNRIDNPAKYVSTAIPLALKKLVDRYGCHIIDIESVIVGGARILNMGASINIGARNVEMARKVIREYGIRLVGEDVGGSHSRSVFYEISTGNVYVTSPKLRLSLFS